MKEREQRIAITGHGEETRKQLIKLHKDINMWVTKNGTNGKRATNLQWGIAAMEALKNKG